MNWTPINIKKEVKGNHTSLLDDWIWLLWLGNGNNPLTITLYGWWRTAARCSQPAQWTTQHNKMKRFVKNIQQMWRVVCFVPPRRKKHLFNIVWFHCYQAEMNTNYYSDWVCSSTLSCVVHYVCELTQDVFFTGSFPTAVPRLSHHLHWPGSLPQSGPHCAIGKYFNAIWCRGG